MREKEDWTFICSVGREVEFDGKSNIPWKATVPINLMIDDTGALARAALEFMEKEGEKG